MEEDLKIPLLMYGPGIPRSRELGGQVGILDIAPTAARFLGLEPPEEWLGRPISI
jgi:arylsulfatase A-like enzyme